MHPLACDLDIHSCTSLRLTANNGNQGDTCMSDTPPRPILLLFSRLSSTSIKIQFGVKLRLREWLNHACHGETLWMIMNEASACVCRRGGEEVACLLNHTRYHPSIHLPTHLFLLHLFLVGGGGSKDCPRVLTPSHIRRRTPPRCVTTNLPLPIIPACSCIYLHLLFSRPLSLSPSVHPCLSSTSPLRRVSQLLGKKEKCSRWQKWRRNRWKESKVVKAGECFRRIGASTHHESNSSMMEYPGLQREAEATGGKSRREEEQEETEGCSHQDGMETQTNEKN